MSAVYLIITTLYPHPDLWNVYGECENFAVMKGHTGSILELHYSTDGRLVYDVICREREGERGMTCLGQVVIFANNGLPVWALSCGASHAMGPTIMAWLIKEGSPLDCQQTSCLIPLVLLWGLVWATQSTLEQNSLRLCVNQVFPSSYLASVLAR